MANLAIISHSSVFLLYFKTPTTDILSKFLCLKMENEPIKDTQEQEQEGEEEDSPPLPQKDEPRSHKCCPQERINELATPNRRIFLALWNQHAYHLPKDKVRNLKLLLQRLYAMSPEETATYFAELRAEARAAAMRKKLKQQLRKYLLEKHQQKQRDRAYKLFKKLLKCGIAYAADNPVPPLISIRLRYLSDVILDQLCELRKVEVPNRSNPDKCGLFLISVADWMAIAVERLYYAAQLSINQITNQEQVVGDVPETYEKFGQPAASSTQKKISLDMTVPKKYEDFGQPAGSSTPQRLSFDKTPAKPSTRKRLSLDPFYSFMLDEATTKKWESLNYGDATTERWVSKQVPNYTFNHMRPANLPTTFCNQTTIQMPPYGFTTSKIPQPVKPKSKRLSLDQTPIDPSTTKRLCLDPCQMSFMCDEATTEKRKPPKKKRRKKKPASFCDQTKIPMPPFGFTAPNVPQPVKPKTKCCPTNICVMDRHRTTVECPSRLCCPTAEYQCKPSMCKSYCP